MFKRLLITKDLYKKIIALAIPVMIQNLITNFVALIDNIMIGRVGTEQMTGVAVVNQLFFVFNLAVFGAVSGAGIFGAQFFGKGDNDGVRHTLRYKLISTAVIFVVGTVVFLTFGDRLIESYLNGAERGIDLALTFESAKIYMLIMLAGNFAFALENCYASTLREGGNTKVPMYAGIVAIATNTCLNWLLIFGIGPFPELGVAGAAVATVIARFLQAGIVFFWTHKNREKLSYPKGLYRGFKIPATLAKRITLKGFLPLVINESLWGASLAVLTGCYSLRGVDVVAGLNIASTVTNMFNVMFISIGIGASVILGQMLGGGKFEEARDSAPRLIAFSATVCVGVGAILAILAPLFPMAYNTTDEIKQMAVVFTRISALCMPIYGFCHCTYFTLRSGGKTIITFLFDSGYSWVIAVPLAYCLSHFTGLHVYLVYFIVQTSELLKCFVGGIMVKKNVWITNIVSD